MENIAPITSRGPAAAGQNPQQSTIRESGAPYLHPRGELAPAVVTAPSGSRSLRTLAPMPSRGRPQGHGQGTLPHNEFASGSQALPAAMLPAEQRTISYPIFHGHDENGEMRTLKRPGEPLEGSVALRARRHS